MRTKLKRVSPETALLRVLDALAQEAIEASDAEVTEAATDLRMDLGSRESAAFAGLTYFARPQLSDFFDTEVAVSLPVSAKQIDGGPLSEPKDRRRSKRLRMPIELKPPGGK
jgi:hypothetical protein